MWKRDNIGHKLCSDTGVSPDSFFFYSSWERVCLFISMNAKWMPEGKNFAYKVTMTKQKQTSSETGIFAYIWDLVAHRQWLWWKSSQTWSGLAGRAMKFLAIPAFRNVHRKWRSQPIHNTTGVAPFIGNKNHIYVFCPRRHSSGKFCLPAT